MGNRGKLFKEKEIIRGYDVDNPYEQAGQPEHFDTMRSVAIYYGIRDSSTLPEGAIYINAFNYSDHAICVLIPQKVPEGIPPIRVAINQELQALIGERQRWRINAGDTFTVWMGGESFEDRDTRFGHAIVNWTNPLDQ